MVALPSAFAHASVAGIAFGAALAMVLARVRQTRVLGCTWVGLGLALGLGSGFGSGFGLGFHRWDAIGVTHGSARPGHIWERNTGSGRLFCGDYRR